jgi:threonine aldolase
MKCVLDLRSDTFSVPCKGMRKAIAEAEVGDDVFGEDPTINSLEARTAELFGKEKGLFVASGTMGNGLAIRSLTSPGDQVLCGSNSHVYNFEGDQFALNCGIQMHRIDERPDGMIPPEEIRKALSRKEDIHRAPRTLLALENTHNLLGGRILPRQEVTEVCALAHSLGTGTYLDGARIWHVHAATGIPLNELAFPFDMISVCFSKALGAPVGSMVLGSADLTDRARWFRKRMGGGMRQAGILGAACHYALDHNLSRLSLTHDYARRLAMAFSSTRRFEVDTDAVQTNIVFLKTEPGQADSIASSLHDMGLLVLALDRSSVRIVTHLSLDPGCVDEAVIRIEKEF